MRRTMSSMKQKNNQDDALSANKMDQKVLLQRMILVVASIALAYATFYGYAITRQRIQAVDDGKKVRTIVSRISSKRTLKTVYVTIDGLERDAGDPIGECATGDSIGVYYRPSSLYVAPVGRENFTSMLVFQTVCFAASIVLFGVALFYPKEKIIKYIEKQNR